jgi:hypothetical protein
MRKTQCIGGLGPINPLFGVPPGWGCPVVEKDKGAGIKKPRLQKVIVVIEVVKTTRHKPLPHKTTLLGGQNRSHYKPPKFLMGKQI